MPYRIILPIFFLSLLFLFLNPISTGDFFHHLNTGKYIVENLALPYKDNLSFTAFGLPWVAYAWGSGLVFYIIYQIFGAVGISIFFAILGTLASFILFLILKELKIKTLHSLTFVFLGASIISLRWPTRPEILGPLFLTLLIYLLYKIKQPSYFMILCFFLWSIFYGSSSFLGVLVLLAFYVTHKLFTKKSVFVLTACIIASMVNGYGLRSFFYIFQIPSVAPHIAEWQSIINILKFPELAASYQATAYLYILFVVFCSIVLVAGFIKTRSTLFKNKFLSLLALSLFAPFFTIRFINTSPLLTIPVIALIITNLNKKLQYIFTCIAIFIASIAILTHLQSGIKTGLDRSQFNKETIEYFNKTGLKGNIFTLMEVGSYLSYNLPDSKIFIDTRDDLYQPTGIFDDINLLAENKISMPQMLNKYNADIVVDHLRNRMYYERLLLRPDWNLVYIENGFFVIINDKLAQKYQIRVERHLRLPDN